MAPRSARRAGLTMVELLVSVAVLSVVLGGVTTAVLSGQGAFRRSVTSGDLQGQTRRTLERVVHELSAARIAGIAPLSPGWAGSSSWIEFETFQGGSELWGPRTRIQFELSPSELDNGADDDGNGLVDEGMVVRIERVGEADEKRTVLARGVRRYLEGEEPNGADDNGNGLIDEAGLAISRDGGTLTVRLSMERLGPNEQVMVSTFETTVRLRN